MPSRPACTEADPADFFPDTSRGITDPYQRARRICGECEVREECLRQTLEVEGSVAERRHGMWGGLSPDERAALAQGVGR